MSIEIISNGITEAQASAVYFLQNTSFSTGNAHAVVVDIGGGTTDLSFWLKREIQWEDSVKFAGEDLIGVLDDLRGFVTKVYVKGEGSSNYGLAMRDWPFVHRNWNDKMEGFKQHDFKGKVFRTMGLFYGGLCYYIGMHMKREKIKTELNQIAFAGNGIRFLEIITNGNQLSEGEDSLKHWVNLLKKMIAAGHDIPNKKEYNTTFVFSQNPKLEIAEGLVSESLINYTAKSESTKKMFGLDFKLKGKNYTFDKWDAGKKAVDFSSAEIDFSVFDSFIKAFKKEAQVLFKDWNLDILSDGTNNKIRNDLFNSLEKRGNQELANSLFLEVLHSYMKEQYQQ